MGNTLTVRLPKELEDWLRETSRKTGIPIGQLVRSQLERARADKDGAQKILQYAGEIEGPPDLSSRKGYSRR